MGSSRQPVDLQACTDLELMSYVVNVDTSDECNQVYGFTVADTVATTGLDRLGWADTMLS